MATYAIGDLHGCLEPLQRLLDRLNFDPVQDRLWFVGDLINRGPQSLDTLRFVRSLGQSAICVLGNHDLHLLAVVHGYRNISGKDTLDEILNAPDRDVLCNWLSHRPLLYVDEQTSHVLVHAGIYPHWSLKRAIKEAKRAESALREDLHSVLKHMYGNSPAQWSTSLSRRQRLRFAINSFTRMRYCEIDGSLDFSFNGPIHAAPGHLVPWYRVSGREAQEYQIVFGHWSSHPAICAPGLLPLDRGCVWKGSLAAYSLDRQCSTSVACVVDDRPQDLFCK